MADEATQAAPQVQQAPIAEEPKHPLYPAADPAHEGMALSDAAKSKLATLAGTVIEETPQSVVEMYKRHMELTARVKELAQVVEELVAVVGK